MKEKIIDMKFDSSKDNIFFVADTHFFHKNIIKYCFRPFLSITEMNETLIKNWNSKVSPGDIVFHLGDFAFCGSKEYKEILSQLNGDIYLILGNHDRKSIKEKYGFKGVYQQLYIKIDNQRIYLNHLPFLCFDGAWRGLDATWQLFGHVHSRRDLDCGLDNQRLKYLFPTQYDVGVDNNNFTPVSYQEVKEIIHDQQMSLNMYRGGK